MKNILYALFSIIFTISLGLFLYTEFAFPFNPNNPYEFEGFKNLVNNFTPYSLGLSLIGLFILALKDNKVWLKRAVLGIVILAVGIPLIYAFFMMLAS